MMIYVYKFKDFVVNFMGKRMNMRFDKTLVMNVFKPLICLKMYPKTDILTNFCCPLFLTSFLKRMDFKNFRIFSVTIKMMNKINFLYRSEIDYFQHLGKIP